MGNPSGVVQTTVVICSFFSWSIGKVVVDFRFRAYSSSASGIRSSGMDLEMRLAQRLSQV